ncbi:hypothetical protein F0562_026663 [Nyssa sinensis]|uniref:Uncharacterized protein n=1 Tax=Nyssa sinensis TaxID=561372 RepID=A0A5J5BFP2_9ASTE|nr:hypothetical protein F0562_026663 [Nyssa sinensis]
MMLRVTKKKNVPKEGGAAVDGESEGDDGDRGARCGAQREGGVDQSIQQNCKAYRGRGLGNDREAAWMWGELKLIEAAWGELKLICNMIEWDPWRVPDGYECEVIENGAPVPKYIPLHRPGPLPEEFNKTFEAVTSGTLEAATSHINKDEPAITAGK